MDTTHPKTNKIKNKDYIFFPQERERNLSDDLKELKWPKKGLKTKTKTN